MELLDHAARAVARETHRAHQHRAEREILEALRRPFGPQLGAGHTPHLLGVALEEGLVEPLAEAVHHPALEGVLGRQRHGPTPEIAREGPRGFERPEAARACPRPGAGSGRSGRDSRCGTAAAGAGNRRRAPRSRSVGSRRTSCRSGVRRCRSGIPCRPRFGPGRRRRVRARSPPRADRRAPARLPRRARLGPRPGSRPARAHGSSAEPYTPLFGSATFVAAAAIACAREPMQRRSQAGRVAAGPVRRPGPVPHGRPFAVARPGPELRPAELPLLLRLRVPARPHVSRPGTRGQPELPAAARQRLPLPRHRLPAAARVRLSARRRSTA